jgi:hypothetical protein
MSHHPEPAVDDHCQDTEDANWQACHAAAYLCGYSFEDADNCEDGAMGCPECPFSLRDRKEQE